MQQPGILQPAEADSPPSIGRRRFSELRKFVCRRVGDPFWISSSSLNAQTG
jgi:hypothetical protein